MSLLQHNIEVAAFCISNTQETTVTHVFGKPVIYPDEMLNTFPDAWVIVGGRKMDEIEELQKMGINNIVYDNVSYSDIWVVTET